MIQPLSTTNNSTDPAGAAAPAGTTAAAADPNQPTQQMFLQLLVAQIKNQDPLNPTDGVQFLGELAQFSQLEQLIGIRQDLDGATSASLPGAAAPPAAPAPATPAIPPAANTAQKS